jgi:hypothetical protein
VKNKMFSIKIDTKNAAFAGGYKEEEIARLLEEIAFRVRNGILTGLIYDINGNFVGNFKGR